jgi:ApbE superfamily uncharacterized protein (UPF0280 family)
MFYEERKYRKLVYAPDLVKFEVAVKESDLLILADQDLSKVARGAIVNFRNILENYIKEHLDFATTFEPYYVWVSAPSIIRNMAWAAKRANVGPMASVAGALAEYVGKELLKFSNEVIVENGGDIFIKSLKKRRIAVHAGTSLFSENIALEIDPQDTPCSVCTSSGTIGHSFSFGRADAVCVVSNSAALADAAATAIANKVKSESDIEEAIKFSKKIRGLKGVLIIKDEHMGAIGKIKIVSI